MMQAVAYVSSTGKLAGQASTGNCSGCGWKWFASEYPAEEFFVEVINARGKLHYTHGVEPLEKQVPFNAILKAGV